MEYKLFSVADRINKQSVVKFKDLIENGNIAGEYD